MNKYLKFLAKLGARSAVGALAAGLIIKATEKGNSIPPQPKNNSADRPENQQQNSPQNQSQNSPENQQNQTQNPPETLSESRSSDLSKPLQSQPQNTQNIAPENPSEPVSLALSDEFYPLPEEIYVPDARKAGKGEVPYIALTEKEAVERGWSFRKKSKSVRITKYRGGLSEPVIPSAIGGKRVNELGERAFYKSRIERVYIPGSIVKIGENAFCFSKVREVIFGSRENGLREITDSTFYSCSELTRVILPDTLYRIGKRAFSFCKSLEYIAFPDSLFSVEDSAFANSGLRGFSFRYPIRLKDGEAFVNTPLHENYKIIATKNSAYKLIVLLVKRGAKIKFPPKTVEFKQNPFYLGCTLDLSECTDLYFGDDPNKIDYSSTKKNIVLRKGQEGFYFGKEAVVRYTDGSPYPELFQPIGQDGDTLIVKHTSSYRFPHITYIDRKFDVKSLRLVSEKPLLYIKYGAFCFSKTERLELDFCIVASGAYPGGEIFADAARLREFRWKDRKSGKKLVQYIPPGELIKWFHEKLLGAFSSTENDGFFDSSVFEQAFKCQRFEERYYRIKAIDAQVHQRHLIPIAIDVLRSTPEQFEGGTEIYSDYLRRHIRYARKLCEKLTDYPEYAEFLRTFK